MIGTGYEIDIGLCIRKYLYTDDNPYHTDKLTLIFWKVELILGIKNTICVHVTDSILTQEHQIEIVSTKFQTKHVIFSIL